MVHVLVVSDIRIYRDGLREALGRSERLHVTGAAASPAETFAHLNRAPVDAVLLDTATRDALALTQAIVDGFKDARVVAFGLSESRQEIMEYAEAGISGYVPKEGSVDDLVKAVLRAVRGELECSADISGALLRRVSELAARHHPKAVHVDLTPREWEVAGLIKNGLSNKEIASRLDIREATAKAHVHQVLAKLGARRRGEVILHLPEGLEQQPPLLHKAFRQSVSSALTSWEAP